MPSLNELSNAAGTPLATSQADSVGDVSDDQRLTFKQYRRVVLPADGFIFWVSCNIEREITGSAHIQTNNTQDEWQAANHGKIILTTPEELPPFRAQENELDTVWVGVWEGMPFAIGSQSARYVQAGLCRYVGDTITPAFAAQFLDTEDDLKGLSPYASTSLPLFLRMPQYPNPALAWCPWPSGTSIFPSFSVPDNQKPPYITVHIEASATKPLSMGTLSAQSGTTGTIVKEHVRLRLLGLNNARASNLLNYITHWALIHADEIGVLNTPIVVDEKNPLPNINALAPLKTIELDIMYSQSSARDAALQTITHATTSLRSS